MTLTVAYALVPSKQVPGKYLVVSGGQQVSVLPGGTVALDSVDPLNDGNYQQAEPVGLGLKFQPGGDVNPNAPAYVLLPE